MNIDFEKLSKEDVIFVRLLMLDYPQAQEAWPDHEVFKGDEDGLVIDYMGGACPTQSEGTIQGIPFYYRARHGSWSLGIGQDPVSNGDINLFGDDPHVGWVPDEDVKAVLIIGNSLVRYLDQKGALTR